MRLPRFRAHCKSPYGHYIFDGIYTTGRRIQIATVIVMRMLLALTKAITIRVVLIVNELRNDFVWPPQVNFRTWRHLCACPAWGP